MSTQKNRNELKSFFRANQIPTEEQFGFLIDSGINQIDDRMRRDPIQGIAIEAAGGAGTSRPALALFSLLEDQNPAWTLDVQPQGTASGLGFVQGGGTPRLFLQNSNEGRVGIGTLTPEGQTHIAHVSHSADASYSSQKNNLGLVIGTPQTNNVGTIKLYGGNANDFTYLHSGQGITYVDSTMGQYRFNADPDVRGANEGMLSLYDRNGQEQIRLHTNGASYLAGGGKLGLGTNSPQQALHVHAPGAVTTRFSSGNGYLDIGISSPEDVQFVTPAKRVHFAGQELVSPSHNSPNGQPLRLKAGSTQITLERDTQRVGIATDSPGTTLDVNGGIRGHHLWALVSPSPHSNAATFESHNDEPTYVNWYHKGSRAFFLQGGLGKATLHADAANIIALTGGQVGVGTDLPQGQLHVSGGPGVFNSYENQWPLRIQRLDSTPEQALHVGVSDNETIFHYRNDEAESFVRFRLENTDQERADNKGANASTHDILRLRATYQGGLTGINTVPHAALSIGGTGKATGPDGVMHITPGAILFGGGNVGMETNSGQISAGMHEGNSLNITGIGKTWQDRRISLFAEGGLNIYGYIRNPRDASYSQASLRIGDNQFLGEKIYSLAFGENTDTQTGMGLIPSSVAPSEMKRNSLGIHVHNTSGILFLSSGWDRLMSIEGGTGNTYVKGKLGSGGVIETPSNVLAGQKIGIGNTNPLSSIHIGAVDTANHKTWMDRGIYMADSSDTMYVGLKANAANRLDSVIAWGDDPDDSLVFLYNQHAQAEKEVARFTAQGELGIGTNDPQANLHVAGSARIDDLFPERMYRKVWVATANGPSDGTDVGKIPSRTLVFHKYQADTVLKITYSDNLRVHGHGAAHGRWEVRIDDKSAPHQPIIADWYNWEDHAGNTHLPAVVVGYARAISPGQHTISIWVMDEPSHGPHHSRDRYTGWNNSTWTIEVEELYTY